MTGERHGDAPSAPLPTRGTVLVARMDNVGDVLLAGPAVRAVAAHARRVVMLAGPRGRAAAELLPGVDRVIEWHTPWIDPHPRAVRVDAVEELIAAIRSEAPEAAFVLTSFHQSPLPLALVLRLADVPWIGAISEDYPGSLLDLRHRAPTGPPEAERMLSLVEEAGYLLPPGDRGAPAVRRPLPDTAHLTGRPGYIVVHAGASAPARAIPRWLAAGTVAGLGAEGRRVVVTGADGDREDTAAIAGRAATDLGGRTGLAELAGVLRDAAALVTGNTGPAHLAAAVDTPVVSLFSPVVPASAWAPYGTRLRLLGDQNAACKDTRARTCPVPGHPCLNSLSAADVVAAVHDLIGEGT
ncbi:MAG: glycosyltransferase family 9 protein [Nocardiopsaceae bacterium]|nr:glycosyltransferase family 9 protein [Nocardiopsaceae bacterium]